MEERIRNSLRKLRHCLRESQAESNGQDFDANRIFYLQNISMLTRDDTIEDPYANFENAEYFDLCSTASQIVWERRRIISHIVKPLVNPFLLQAELGEEYASRRLHSTAHLSVYHHLVERIDKSVAEEAKDGYFKKLAASTDYKANLVREQDLLKRYIAVLKKEKL